MSSYEDYGRASSDYDASRVAVGSEIVLGALVGAGISLAEAKVLDAGCGTGSYAAAVATHVASLTLVDADADMLARAEAKLTAHGAGARIELHQGLLCDLPFEHDAFDAVMVNQVLHHVGDSEGGEWSEHRAAVAGLSRVLRPGGVLVVNTCSQRQLQEAYWYYALIPVAADALRRRYAPLEQLESAMAAAGLIPTGRFVPAGQALQGPSYFNGRAPLEESWRQGDSVWCLATDGELAGALEQIRALDEEGRLAAFVTEHDDRRVELGQLTFLTARKR